MAEVWPNIPHQICQFHARRFAGRLIDNADHRVKTDMRIRWPRKNARLSFGLDEDDHTPPALCKILRDNHGYEQQTLLISSIPWQQQAQRVLDIATLVRTIQQKTGAASFTSAQFALQMIEGAEEVIFQSAATGDTSLH